MTTVLLAHDLTDRSTPVTAAAADLAVRLEADLIVAYVIGEEELERDRKSRPADSAYSDHVMRQLAGRLSARVEAQLPTPDAISFRTEILVGEPEDELPAYLDRHQPDYTFIGMRSRSRVGKLLFGSVPQAVLLRGHGKVVSVPVD